MNKLKLQPGLRSIRLGSPRISGAPAVEPQDLAPQTTNDNAALKLPVGNVKDLQRMAFQRGREAALEEVQDVLLGAVRELRSTLAAVQSSREVDRQRYSEFAIKLSCTIAEELTGQLVSAGEHDVAGLVKRILDELYPNGAEGRITLRGHPNDIALLGEHVPGSEAELQLVPDGSVPRASFHVEGEGVIFDSNVVERLERIRERLLREEGDGEPA